ncbi:MAG: BrnT family toxin [Synergistaceae bacterium]|nr:BrnT family toxin [Synergistaceae bacterium]
MDRYKIIGRIMDKETILSVIYVERVNRCNVELIRIISAREAARKEKELYGMELPERLSARQRRSNRTYEDNQRRGY